MKRPDHDKLRHCLRALLLPVCIAVLAAAILFTGVRSYSSAQTEQNRQLTLSAIRKAAVQCYADEGSYPSQVDYLEDNYGVEIDHDSYYVLYDCIASNVFPNIDVYTRGE